MTDLIEFTDQLISLGWNLILIGVLGYIVFAIIYNLMKGKP